MKMEGSQTKLGGYSTGGMLNLVYAVVSIYCTWYMLYLVYTVLGVYCTQCMLYSLSTHGHGIERYRGMT